MPDAKGPCYMSVSWDRHGIGSRAVLAEKKSEDRYLMEGRKTVPEGVEAMVPHKGSISNIVEELRSGIQVAFGYVGARTLTEFHKNITFIQITQASLQESAPHTLSSFTKN